jgi:hypothetical protein
MGACQVLPQTDALPVPRRALFLAYSKKYARQKVNALIWSILVALRG